MAIVYVVYAMLLPLCFALGIMTAGYFLDWSKGITDQTTLADRLFYAARRTVLYTLLVGILAAIIVASR